MKIELWSLSKIKPYKGNPRRHEPAVAAVARSIEQFGFRQPIVVDKKGVIIAGHVRFYASQELKLARVPVHVALDLTPHQARAYRLADNKTGELAEWDQNLLGLELRELSNVNFDIASLGFTAGEIAQLINGTPYGKTDPDDVPPKPKRAVTKPGDLYLLGAHRLLCGDSTKGDDLRRAMNGEKAAAVITDPPYGVGYVGKTKDALPVHNDGADTLLPLLDSALTMACELCVDGGCWYVAAPAGPQFFDFATVLTKLGVWRQTLVWAKHAIVMGRSDYHYQHEAVFYGWKQGGEHRAPADLPADDDEGDFRAEHDSIIYGWKPGDSHQPPPTASNRRFGFSIGPRPRASTRP
jgi:hypothetical protein